MSHRRYPSREESQNCTLACLRFVMAKNKPGVNWQEKASKMEIEAYKGGCESMCSTFLALHREYDTAGRRRNTLPRALTQKLGRTTGKIITQHASL